jgi:FkbM family methyltransferase
LAKFRSENLQVLVRSYIYRALAAVDRRLRLRQWLRTAIDSKTQQSAQSNNLDPFGSPELQHSRPNTVLDIGGSHGQFAREALRYFPDAPIYSFEPIPECYDELLALREQIPNLQPMNVALSDHDGEQELWLSAYRDSSSLQEMLPAHVEAWPHTAVEAKITVKLDRLDAIAPTLNLKEPIFAKLDVQGHELAVIRGGRETLSRCQRVMIECNFAPLYQDQPTFNEIYREMRSMNFRFDGFIGNLRHPRTLELLSADAIFYKSTEQD